MTGPIDYVVLAFPGNQFKGEILPELDKVINNGSIRIVDLIFIVKDENGEVAAVEVENMPEEVASRFAALGEEMTGLLSETDAADIGEMLENNSSGAILIFEHLWAIGLKEAIVNAGGVLVADGRIHEDNVVAAEADLETVKA